ncbi:MAG: HAD family hydrolase [Bdellovibrionales bacterium]
MIPQKTYAYKSFSKELWSNIKSRVDQALRQPGPHYAAFDADGTLWPLDAGETFFRYQIKEGIPYRPPEMTGDPWDHYCAVKKVDVPASCLLLAQINKGLKLTEVRQKAQKCFETTTHFPVHESQRELIAYLQDKKVEVFVVTASIKWAVEPFAKSMGIDAGHVLGIEVTEEGGVLTDQGVYPLSVDAGKATVLLERTKGVRPILASGNTTHDAHLVETASTAPLAVASALPGEVNVATEARLKGIAQEKGWLHHSFA